MFLINILINIINNSNFLKGNLQNKQNRKNY